MGLVMGLVMGQSRGAALFPVLMFWPPAIALMQGRGLNPALMFHCTDAGQGLFRPLIQGHVLGNAN